VKKSKVPVCRPGVVIDALVMVVLFTEARGLFSAGRGNIKPRCRSGVLLNES